MQTAMRERSNMPWKSVNEPESERRFLVGLPISSKLGLPGLESVSIPEVDGLLAPVGRGLPWSDPGGVRTSTGESGLTDSRPLISVVNVE